MDKMNATILKQRKQEACGSFQVLYGNPVHNQIFHEVYYTDVEAKMEQGTDLHQEFADRLGISRQEAKLLCHKINYNCITDLSKRSKHYPVIDFMRVGD